MKPNMRFWADLELVASAILCFRVTDVAQWTADSVTTAGSPSMYGRFHLLIGAELMDSDATQRFLLPHNANLENRRTSWSLSAIQAERRGVCRNP